MAIAKLFARLFGRKDAPTQSGAAARTSALEGKIPTERATKDEPKKPAKPGTKGKSTRRSGSGNF
ncbi:MAG TPA: hypothetical protein GX743_11610 [Actinomycetales bacterium]|nr:hypothetical protein [Actinomycetales bacterium]